MKYNVLVRVFEDHISWQKSLGWGMSTLEKAAGKLRKDKMDFTPEEEQAIIETAKIYVGRTLGVEEQLASLMEQIEAERRG
jgi:hypothetical protein